MRTLLLCVLLGGCGGGQEGQSVKLNRDEGDCLARVELQADAMIVNSCPLMSDSCLNEIEAWHQKEARRCLELY